MITQGMTGSIVSTLQSQLNQLGANLTVDGDFGPLTLEAVIAFQIKNGLGKGGVVGPVTQAAINKALASLSANVIFGMDVSNYQPGISWNVVAASDIKFAFIKATEGISIVDSDFAVNWAGAKAAKIARGAYHFFHPGDNPTTAANIFLSTIGTLSSGDLPPVFDWEVTEHVSNSVAIANAQIWLNIVEAATGLTPIIYCGPSFWNALGNPAQFAKYPLFIADWYVTHPKIPAPWSNWTFWQYTDSGTASGVASSGLDLDQFNGSASQLRALCKP